MGLSKKECVEFGTGMAKMMSLAWSPVGDLLATVGWSGEQVVLWNSNGTFNKELHVMAMDLIDYDEPKFSNDGSFIVVSYVFYMAPTTYRQFDVFDTSTGDVLQWFQVFLPIFEFQVCQKMAWKDELEVICPGLDNTFSLWRIGQEEPLQTITGFDVSSEMAFNQKRNILAFGGRDRAVFLWHTDMPDMAVSILTGHNAHVTDIVWQSNHSNVLASSDELGQIRIWDTETETVLHVYDVFQMDENHISFSPDGRFLAVARCEQGGVKVVKFDTGETVAVCPGNGVAVNWSPRGDKIAVKTQSSVSPREMNTSVFNVAKINFGINLKGLSMMRVASLLEGIIDNRKEAKEFLASQIPEMLIDDVCSYLK